jgi:hypothetical protein
MRPATNISPALQLKGIPRLLACHRAQIGPDAYRFTALDPVGDQRVTSTTSGPTA